MNMWSREWRTSDSVALHFFASRIVSSVPGFHATECARCTCICCRRKTGTELNSNELRRSRPVASLASVGSGRRSFGLLWLVRSAARRDRMLFSGSFSILDIIHHLSCVVLISLNQTNKSLSICACVCSVVRTGVYRGRLAPWGSPYCNVSQPHESRSRSYG